MTEKQSRIRPEPIGQEATPAAEWPKEISTTMEPNRRYSVGEAEYRDLKAQKLLKEGN